MKDIELLKKYYGFTTAEAIIYRKSITEKTIKKIEEYYKINSKKSFYED